MTDVKIRDTGECLAKYKQFATLLAEAHDKTTQFLATIQDIEKIGINMNAAKEALSEVKTPLAESLETVEAQHGLLKRACANLDESQNIQTF